MKNIQYLLLILCILTSLTTFSQKKSEKSKMGTSDVFTSKERDSMQVWFYNRATAMGLNDESREEYYNIILYYTYKMRRLGMKEEALSEEEIRLGFNSLLKKQHSEIKAILTDDQYNQYLKKYDIIVKGVYKRNGWDKK